MIYDSGIWKIELQIKAEEFKNLIRDTDFSQSWYSEIDKNGNTKSYLFFIEFQKYCFYSAVIARKFFESNRLSDELIFKSYSIEYFNKKTDKLLSKDNFDNIDEEYDLENLQNENLTIEKICHLFIHSFIFTPDLKERKINNEEPDEVIENWTIDGISGLYINTDFTKEKKVYFFSLELIFEIFKNVYEDDILYIYENRVTNEILRSRNYPENYEKPDIITGHNNVS